METSPWLITKNRITGLTAVSFMPNLHRMENEQSFSCHFKSIFRTAVEKARSIRCFLLESIHIAFAIVLFSFVVCYVNGITGDNGSRVAITIANVQSDRSLWVPRQKKKKKYNKIK